ncbi:MAG: class II aldolase/adducin family protein [Candidatus Methylomirabilis sp.]
MDRSKVLDAFQWVGRDLYHLGLITLHAGNMSLRSGERIWITRTGSMLGHLEPDDLVETPLSPEESPHPKASMELPVHLAIYRATSAQAILHAHPPSAVALSLVEEAIVPADSEGGDILGRVPVIAAVNVVASQEVADRASSLLGDHRAVVIRGHGSFAVASSLEEALGITTTLEASAKILLLAKAAGWKPER